MKWLKKLSLVVISLGILFGCGSSNNPAPPPVVPGPAGIPGTNCSLLTGGTPLSSVPFIGTLYNLQSPNYQWSTSVSSLTLSPSIVNNLGYGYQSTILASGSVFLSELSTIYGQTNTGYSPTTCIASPTTTPNNNTGYFSNGQVRSLVLTGAMTVPYYSPFSWGGYPTGSPGTNPTLGQQVIQVLVGSNCVASFVPSYGNNTPGRIRGCVTVRIGNQTYNYQSQ